jgi:septum formation protein
MGQARSLLLASNSPRRIELLGAAGFQFETVSPEIDERFDVDLTLRELTGFNALRKGMAIARKNPHHVVLAADTLVALGHEVIGKPVDLADARKILRRLSGRTHEVCSAVFIAHCVARKSTLFHEISRVRFRRLTGAGIDDYIAKVNPLDKAGAYAAQGFGAHIIEEIDGSFTNVVGLPMDETIAALAEFGLRPAEEKI